MTLSWQRLREGHTFLRWLTNYAKRNVVCTYRGGDGSILYQNGRELQVTQWLY